MKNILILFLLAASALFAQTNSKPLVTAIDGYAARVNNHVITYGDIRRHIGPMIQQAMQRFRGPELAQQLQQLHIDGREALIDEALMAEEAKRNEFQLPPYVIDEEIDSLIRERFEGSRAQLTKALMQQRMTFDEWREDVAENLVMRVYYNQEVLQHATVSDEEVLAEYEKIKDQFHIPYRVKYRYILINKGTTEEDQAVKRKQAEDTYQKLADGADFSDVAEEVSEGNRDLSPWRDPADVKVEMRQALYDTPAGEISELIEADDVFYIIQVESRQEEGFVPFDDVRDRIRSRLLGLERERLHKDLIERLSAKHRVERY